MRKDIFLKTWRGDFNAVAAFRTSDTDINCRVKGETIMKKSLCSAVLSFLTFSAFSIPTLAQTFSDWSPPVNLSTINTSSFEG